RARAPWAQNGHWKSPNSTIVTGASEGPREGEPSMSMTTCVGRVGACGCAARSTGIAIARRPAIPVSTRRIADRRRVLSPPSPGIGRPPRGGGSRPGSPPSRGRKLTARYTPSRCSLRRSLAGGRWRGGHPGQLAVDQDFELIDGTVAVEAEAVDEVRRG